MKLSSKTHYGLMACHILGVNYPENTVSASALEGYIAVSGKYLEKIMRMLSARGIVTANRGASGGYYLAKPPSEITVGEIVRALEDDGARVLANLPREDAIADIDAGHARGARLQQAVGEAAGRRAGIEAAHALDALAECRECAFQLVAATRHVARLVLHPHVGIRRHHLRRTVGIDVGDLHLVGLDGAQRIAGGFEKPPVDEQVIQADLLHGALRDGRANRLVRRASRAGVSLDSSRATAPSPAFSTTEAAAAQSGRR